MNEVEEKDYKLYCDCETDDEWSFVIRLIDSLAQPVEPVEHVCPICFKAHEREPVKRTGDTDIAICKTCQEFCTTGMPLCDKAKKEIGLDDSDIEPVKTEAIDAVIGFIFYFVGFLNDTLPKDKLAEYEEIAKRARAELTGIICMSLAKDIVAWIERLEAENAELKARHERDEKEKRILAEMHGCPTMEYANKCDINRENILTCTDCKIAYAKQEAAK
jgi:hypothetical protein